MQRAVAVASFVALAAFLATDCAEAAESDDARRAALSSSQSMAAVRQPVSDTRNSSSPVSPRAQTGCENVDTLGYCEGFCAADQREPDGVCKMCVFDVSTFSHEKRRDYEFSNDAEDVVNQSAAFKPYLFRCLEMRQAAAFAVRVEKLEVCVKGGAERRAELDYGFMELHMGDSQPRRVTLPKGRDCKLESFTYPHAGIVGNPPKVRGVESRAGNYYGVAEFNVSVRKCVVLQRGDPDRTENISCSLSGGEITIWTTHIQSGMGQESPNRAIDQKQVSRR